MLAYRNSYFLLFNFASCTKLYRPVTPFWTFRNERKTSKQIKELALINIKVFQFEINISSHDIFKKIILSNCLVCANFNNLLSFEKIEVSWFRWSLNFFFLEHYECRMLEFTFTLFINQNSKPYILAKKYNKTHTYTFYHRLLREIHNTKGSNLRFWKLKDLELKTGNGNQIFV